MKSLLRSIQAMVLTGTIFSTVAHASLHEIQSMSEILPFVTSDTLVVFDIDNTLVESQTTLGTVQWQEWEIQRALADGLNESDAFDRSVQRFTQVQMAASVRPVETDTADLVRYLQYYGIPTMALTARPAVLVDRTLDLLTGVGIDLNNLSPSAQEYVFYDVDYAHYKQGILAVSPYNDKGQMLVNLLSQPEVTRPGKVIFVDDKSKYGESVTRALKDLGIPVEVFRYGAADGRVAAFDASIAAYQWEVFEATSIVISDEEAAGCVYNGQCFDRAL